MYRREGGLRAVPWGLRGATADTTPGSRLAVPWRVALLGRRSAGQRMMTGQEQILVWPVRGQVEPQFAHRATDAGSYLEQPQAQGRDGGVSQGRSRQHAAAELLRWLDCQIELMEGRPL